MKKIISIILSVLLGACASVSLSAGAAVKTASISGDTVRGAAGTRVEAAVYINNANVLSSLGNGTVCGVQITLSYDTNALEFVGADGMECVYTDELGEVKYNWQADYFTYSDRSYNAMIMVHDPRNAGIAANGKIQFANLCFEISGSCPPESSFDVTIDVIDVCDSTSKRLISGIEGGKLTVESGTEEQSDRAAAEKVDKAIDALGTVTSLAQKAEVESARAAYDALNATQKGYVTKLTALESAESVIEELESNDKSDRAAAEKVDKAIDALGTVTSLAQKAEVESARAAYDALNATQKGYVTKLTALESAESVIEELEKIKKGDLDLDGRVTVSDIVALRGAIMRGSFTGSELAAGDFDNNDILTVSDITELRKLIMDS